MIVHKFGGTSLADARCIRAAALIVKNYPGPSVVVVSALAGVTNQLLDLAQAALRHSRSQVAWRIDALRLRHEETAMGLLGVSSEADRVLGRLTEILDGLVGSTAVREPDGGDPARRLTDEVCAAGEDLSAELMTAVLRSEGLDATAIDARSVVRTDARFGGAIPRDEETARLVRQVLQPRLAGGQVPVLQGFVGATEDGVTTTLGRGGSDFTAAIIGAALGADEVLIWTDVEGVKSAEPRHVPAARVLPELGYEEAVELAYFGARVVHPAAAKHAAARQISMRVRATADPSHPGTLIRHDIRRAIGVAAIADKPQVTLIKVRSRPMFMAYGFLARVFEVLARHRVPVDLVATSHTSTAFTLDAAESLDEVIDELGRIAEVEVVRDLATISVVGHGLLRQPGISARVFSALGGTPVHLISQASDVCLSFLVDAGVVADVVRRLHDELVTRDGEAA
jgi:aspartate kinase